MSAAPSPAPRLEARRKCVGAFPFVRWSAEKAHKVSRYVARMRTLLVTATCVTCLSGNAVAEDVKNCVQRCEMLCGYFPDHPECKRQAERCVSRCKASPKNSN